MFVFGKTGAVLVLLSVFVVGCTAFGHTYDGQWGVKRGLCSSAVPCRLEKSNGEKQVQFECALSASCTEGPQEDKDGNNAFTCDYPPQIGVDIHLHA